jgi:hypothetical protein
MNADRPTATAKRELRRTRNGPTRVAAVVHEYFAGSHADKLVTKLMRGYELLWISRHPRVDVTSLYVDRPAVDDIGAQLATEHGALVHSSIRHALTDGGDLAVDGVVIVGDQHEEGGRPEARDERGQAVDPRARYFTEIATVFKECGRVAPVFVDKHLGPTWAEAKRVYDLAKEYGIPLMAGSSVPVNFRYPATGLPPRTTVEEVVVAASGTGETTPYHVLELVQSLIEGRRGHESGVASVQFLSGEAFWRAWESGDRWSRALQEAALAASPHADGDPREFYERRRDEPASEAPAQSGGTAGHLPKLSGAEQAVLVEYVDGMKLSILLLTGYMLRRNVAIKTKEYASPFVTTSPTGSKASDTPMVGPLAPPPGHPKPHGWNFDHLAFFVEDFLSTGVAPYAVERTLLANGILDVAMTSRLRGGELIKTPHLAISYKPPVL